MQDSKPSGRKRIRRKPDDSFTPRKKTNSKRPTRKFEDSKSKTEEKDRGGSRPFKKYDKSESGKPGRIKRTSDTTSRINDDRRNKDERENRAYNKYHKSDSAKSDGTRKSYSKPARKYETPKRELKRNKKKNVKISSHYPEFVRLNKFISNAGICSRREADKYIKAGVVSVNGKIITELGTSVKYTDKVKFNDQSIKIESKIYLLLNKPKDFVTTLDDPHAKRTVMDLVKNACRERIYPVGRLDKNTTGLLLFTNDGELTKNLTHPKQRKKKIYHVFLNKNITKLDMQKMVDGFDLEDGFIQVDAISYPDPEDKKQVGIEIHSGRVHIVKRIFEHFGYKIMKLDRVYFAGLTKKNLPRGKWRFLSQKEINILKMNAFE